MAVKEDQGSDTDVKTTQKAMEKLNVEDLGETAEGISAQKNFDSIGDVSIDSKEIAKAADAVAGEGVSGSRFGAVFRALGMELETLKRARRFVACATLQFAPANAISLGPRY